VTTPTVRATALLNDNSSTATATQTGTIPASVQDGDIGLLVVVEATGANTVTTPTGWTLLDGPQYVDTNNGVYLFAKDLTAAEASTTLTVTWSGAGKGCGLLQVWQDADSVAELVDAYNGQAAGGTSLTMATVTTPEDGCAVAHFAVARSATATAPNITWPAGYTEAGEADTSGTSPNFVVSGASLDGGKATAGSTGGSTVTCSQTASGAHMYAVALTAAPVANPLTETLTEDWSSGSIDAGTWDQFGTGTRATASQKLQLTPSAASYVGVVTANTGTRYDLTGSSVYVELSAVLDQRLGVESAYFAVGPAGNSRVDFSVSDGSLLMRSNVAGVQTSQGSLTYNATTHRWLRIRESGGTVYWDTSPDGLTWTQRASWVVSGITLTACRVELGAGVWDGGTSTGSADFDNINTPPTDDGGLRVYVVSASGVKQECDVYVVDSLGTKQSIASKEAS
jgi:hypothetical protein